MAKYLQSFSMTAATTSMCIMSVLLLFLSKLSSLSIIILGKRIGRGKSAEILIIPYEYFLYLANVHGVKVSPRIILFNGLPVEEIIFSQFLSIHLLAYKHKFGLLKVGGTVGIDRSQTGLRNLVFVTANHKWCNFPAVSVGWRISDEPFMKEMKSWLTNLKLRADYGVTGNQDFDSYKSIDTMQGSNMNVSQKRLGSYTQEFKYYC